MCILENIKICIKSKLTLSSVSTSVFALTEGVWQRILPVRVDWLLQRSIRKRDVNHMQVGRQLAELVSSIQGKCCLFFSFRRLFWDGSQNVDEQKIGAMDLNKNGLAELRTILFVNRSPGPQSPTGHRVKALTMSMTHRCMWNRKMWPIDGKQCIRWYYIFPLKRLMPKKQNCVKLLKSSVEVKSSGSYVKSRG